MKRMLALFAVLLVGLTSLAVHAVDRADFLVDADWLAGNLADPKLVLLEVRYYSHRYGTVGHITGASQVQRFADLGDNDALPIMRFPSRDTFQATLRAELPAAVSPRLIFINFGRSQVVLPMPAVYSDSRQGSWLKKPDHWNSDCFLQWYEIVMAFLTWYK